MNKNKAAAINNKQGNHNSSLSMAKEKLKEGSIPISKVSKHEEGLQIFNAQIQS